MKYFSMLIPFLAGWLLLIFTSSFQTISLINGAGQLILFAFLVCIPIMRTGRMSYVDIAWPWGLVLLGVITFMFSEGHIVRKSVVSAAYIFAGARMGLGALYLLKLGKLDRELPRYEYQKHRWKKTGKTNVSLAMQVDAIVQGLGNASFLAMPAFIIAANTSTTISLLEVLGLLVWLGAFLMESVADIQKNNFLRAMKKAGKRKMVCNVGLWRYSRHPNYFAEWMVWNGLVLAAIPSWIALYNVEHILVWGLLAVGLFFTSRSLYVTLVYYTGAVPAEFYSVQKRPEYKEYQRTTNIFFPGKPKL